MDHKTRLDKKRKHISPIIVKELFVTFIIWQERKIR